jgi:hypothetical protein
VGTLTAVSVNPILQTEEIFLGVAVILNNYLYWLIYVYVIFGIFGWL